MNGLVIVFFLHQFGRPAGVVTDGMQEMQQ
jgi:hypothetical protein